MSMSALRVENIEVSGYALVDGDDLYISDNESITEDDAANATFGANVKIEGDRQRNTGDLPKLRD